MLSQEFMDGVSVGTLFKKMNGLTTREYEFGMFAGQQIAQMHTQLDELEQLLGPRSKPQVDELRDAFEKYILTIAELMHPSKSQQ